MGDAASLGSSTDPSVLPKNLAINLVGFACNSFIFGVGTAQAIYYWRHSLKTERSYLKGMVIAINVFNALHMVVYSMTVWSFVIPAHGGADSESRALPWWADAQYAANAMGVLAVHCFYIHRIWALGKNKIQVVLLTVLVLVDFALAMYISIYSPVQSRVSDALIIIARQEAALCASLTLTDLSMTTSLVFLLSRSRRTGMNHKSQRLVKRLIFYTLTTGVLTVICAILALITNLVYPQLIWSTTFYDLGAGLYACSLLASLNAREGLRSNLVQTGLTTLPGLSGFIGRNTTAAAGEAYPMQTIKSECAQVQKDTATYLNAGLE